MAVWISMLAGGPRFYLPHLDGLRFVAFAAVFGMHSLQSTAPGQHPGAWLRATIDAGAFGVDLFFILSSFLITSLLLREEAATGRVSVGAFWMRRILRIWPLYFTVVLADIVVERLPRWYTAGLLTFTVNWAMRDGIYDSATAPLWSVSIEEQFYLVWPVLLWAVGRRGLPWLGLGLLCLSPTVRAALLIWDTHLSPVALWVHTFARLDPIAVGALLAVGVERTGRVQVPTRVAHALGLGVAGAIIGLLRAWPVFTTPHRANEVWIYSLIAGCSPP